MNGSVQVSGSELKATGIVGPSLPTGRGRYAALQPKNATLTPDAEGLANVGFELAPDARRAAIWNAQQAAIPAGPSLRGRSPRGPALLNHQRATLMPRPIMGRGRYAALRAAAAPQQAAVRRAGVTMSNQLKAAAAQATMRIHVASLKPVAVAPTPTITRVAKPQAAVAKPITPQPMMPQLRRRLWALPTPRMGM